jgi:uncharacterized membrane-anchored protein
MTKIQYQQARMEVTAYYIRQGKKDLKQACESVEMNYTTIYNQLAGITAFKLYLIKEFVEKLDDKYTAKEIEVNGNYELLICRR